MVELASSKEKTDAPQCPKDQGSMKGHTLALETRSTAAFRREAGPPAPLH